MRRDYNSKCGSLLRGRGRSILYLFVYSDYLDDFSSSKNGGNSVEHNSLVYTIVLVTINDQAIKIRQFYLYKKDMTKNKYTGHIQQLQRVVHDFAKKCIKKTTM